MTQKHGLHLGLLPCPILRHILSRVVLDIILFTIELRNTELMSFPPPIHARSSAFHKVDLDALIPVPFSAHPKIFNYSPNTLTWTSVNENVEAEKIWKLWYKWGLTYHISLVTWYEIAPFRLSPHVVLGVLPRPLESRIQGGAIHLLDKLNQTWEPIILQRRCGSLQAVLGWEFWN